MACHEESDNIILDWQALLIEAVEITIQFT